MNVPMPDNNMPKADSDRADAFLFERISDKAEHVFTRSSSAQLTTDNEITCLLDSRENFPAWLKAMEEVPSTALENLDKAEKWGLVSKADDWFAVRKLRNLMVHEYLQDAQALLDALQAAHHAVPMLAFTCQALIQRTAPLLAAGR